MHWRAAMRDDVPAIKAFLTRYVESSMFPLTNLRDHGFDGTAPRAMQFWINGGEQIENLFGLSREGVAFPQMPKMSVAVLTDLVALMRSRPILGIIGESTQVHALRGGFGLGRVITGHDVDEPAFSLSLDAIKLPPLDGYTLHPISLADRSVLIDWRSEYQVEVLSAPEHRARALATEDIDTFIVRDSHRVLRHDDVPVAMTGFNARADQAVQIGGVYTPPDHRSRGHARRALALHLVEARNEGISRALLCAANEAAARAYLALGFQQWGTFAMTVYTQPEPVR